MAKREGEVTRVLRRAARTIGQGKYNEALRELLHLSEKYPDAGEIRPQLAEVFLRRGQLRARKGKTQEARADFQRSLDWTPKVETLVALGRTLMIEGKLDRAHELLTGALEIDDQFGPAHEAIGFLLLRWQEYNEAARAFEQTLGLDHATPELYLGAWEVYMHLERFDRAHELILEGAARFPKSGALWAAAGDSFVYAKGESGEARPYWEKAVAINPKNFGALFKLAADAAGREDRVSALEYLRRAAEVDLDQARRLWKEDQQAPLRKFGGVARDQGFLRILGWGND